MRDLGPTTMSAYIVKHRQQPTAVHAMSKAFQRTILLSSLISGLRKYRSKKTGMPTTKVDIPVFYTGRSPYVYFSRRPPIGIAEVY